MIMVVDFGENAKKIYHRKSFPVALEIPLENKFEMETAKAMRQGYEMCPCCGGLAGEMRLREGQLESLEEKYGMTITYFEERNRIYVKSSHGFWKIRFDRESAKYVLQHRNEFSEELSFEELINGRFHREHDRKATESLEKIFYYISEHDKAKVIISDDYHKLPQDTKKQKKYYRTAVNKAKRKAVRRFDSIFMMLEMENPELKNACIY